MATSIIAPQTTADTSELFTIPAGASTMVAVYSDSASAVMGRAKIKIEQQTPQEGGWQPFVDGSTANRPYQPLYLYNTRRSYQITTPGSYRAIKDPTATNVGVMIDPQS